MSVITSMHGDNQPESLSQSVVHASSYKDEPFKAFPKPRKTLASQQTKDACMLMQPSTPLTPSTQLLQGLNQAS